MSNGGIFEALNYALRKSKDGVIVSFVVHPSDVDSALTALPIGARVEIKWRELNEERHSSDGALSVHTLVPSSESAAPQSGEETAATPSKPRVQSLSSQCALRCKDKRFAEFLESQYTHAWRDYGGDVVDIVRRRCSVTSRAELDSNPAAAVSWRQMESDFQSWLTEQHHAGSYR